MIFLYDWEFWKSEVLSGLDVLVNLIQVAFFGCCDFWDNFCIRLAVRLGQVAKWQVLMDLMDVDMDGLHTAL